jgi:hypothetical protein
MSRAWATFAETYGYPGIPFRSIGRHCFDEAKTAADLASTPSEILQARVEQIAAELESLKYWGWGTDLNREHNRLNEELRPLPRERLRRSLLASVELEQVRTPDLALAA